ncbi:MAG TPA: hypothetical protein VFA26_08320, partial [Gemmataceae bacterium]|nr:hypothetical protein [Gemmataceae bacterium]
MSLMDWMGESIRDARQKNDRERLWLASAYGVAYQYRETNPDQALNLFAEAKQLADRLGEPWWALFYEHCKAHALLHFKRDYRNVLDVAVQNALAVRKPPNDQFPGR